VPSTPIRLSTSDPHSESTRTPARGVPSVCERRLLCSLQGGALSGAHGRQVDIEHERCRGGGTRLKGPHGPSTEVPFRDAPLPFLSERQQPATSRQVFQQTHRASSHIMLAHNTQRGAGPLPQPANLSGAWRGVPNHVRGRPQVSCAACSSASVPSLLPLLPVECVGPPQLFSPLKV